MHIKATFWSDDVFVFDELFFVRGQGNEYTTLDRVRLDNPREVAWFFRRVADLVVSAAARKHLRASCLEPYSKSVWYQFAVRKPTEGDFDGAGVSTDASAIGEGAKDSLQILPIIWFDLVLDNGAVLSHDYAFSTILLRRNALRVPLGRFPHFCGQVSSRYRELKRKRQAYKYLSNQIQQALRG